VIYHPIKMSKLNTEAQQAASYTLNLKCIKFSRSGSTPSTVAACGEEEQREHIRVKE